MDLQLEGRPALVTGASRGIGRGTSKILAAEGCKLAICARRKELLEEVADEIQVLVADMIKDIIRFGMGRDSNFFMVSTYQHADEDLVKRAWAIAKSATESFDNERFSILIDRYVL